MLQSIRDKTPKWLAFAVLMALSVPFAFFGINNYFSARSDSYVARMGKLEISPQEFRARFDEYRRGVRQQQGDQFDPAVFETAEVRRKFLEQMIDQTLSTEAAMRIGADPSDAKLREQIEAIPQFQANGAFDASAYQLMLRNIGKTPALFEATMRRDLAAAEVPGQIGRSVLITLPDVDRYIRMRDQLRDFRSLMIPAQGVAEAPPSDADVQAYFDLHKDEFMSPEQVSLDYVEIDASTLEVDGKVDEATLKQRYDEGKNRFVVAEQRQASHILIKVAANADAAAQKAALERATKVAADAHAGKDFAQLAKENSDDDGSKNQGGDLGWLEKGVTEGAFENALFAMAPGTISEPIKTEQGYHVISLRGVKPEERKTFESVRADLEREFLEGERERKFNDLAGQLIEKVYSKPDQLAAIAESLQLKTQHTGLFARTGGAGIASNPNVLKAAFSESVLVEGVASDRIDLGPNHIVLIKVNEHHPRAPRALAEVRPEIVAKISAEHAEKRTREFAQQIEKRFKEGATLDALASELHVPVNDASAIGRTSINQDRDLVREAFKLARPAAGKTERAMATLPAGRYALIELAKVVDGDPAKTDEKQRDSVKRMLTQFNAMRESRALIDSLRDGVEIKVVEERM